LIGDGSGGFFDSEYVKLARKLGIGGLDELLEDSGNCYSDSEAWKKAVKTNISADNTLKDSLYALPYIGFVKGDSAKELDKSHTHYYTEALMDVIGIENYLIHLMQEKGNLTTISRSIKPQDTIHDVMMRAMPDMWQLYRGPGKQHRLVQEENGHIIKIPTDAETPEGYTPALSFPEVCLQFLQDKQSQVQIAEPLELPPPTKISYQRNHTR
jgi:L-rhamnose mutarotase